MNIFRRLIILALAVAICLPCAALAENIHTTGEVNLRKGPGRDYAALGTVPKDATATYLGQTDIDERGVAWYYVSYGGKTGWVSSRFAEFDGSGGGSVHTTGEVNLRKGPGRDYTALGTVPKDATAAYLGQTDTDERGVAWYYVSYDGKTGWVSSRFAELGGFGGGSVHTTGELNLRKGPGRDYAALGTVPKDATATYLGQTDTDERGVAWYYVTYNGKSGWISSRFAELGGGSGSGDYGSGFVTATGDVNLRSGPGKDYALVGMLPENNTASYLGKASVDERGVTWYYVNFTDMTGWVSSAYSKLHW